MGLFSKSKIDRLLLRLYGSSCADCMNMGDETGLLEQIEERRRNQDDNIREDINEIKERLKSLEPKKRKAVIKKKK